jgi:hypothetical protein
MREAFKPAVQLEKLFFRFRIGSDQNFTES